MACLLRVRDSHWPRKLAVLMSNFFLDPLHSSRIGSFGAKRQGEREIGMASNIEAVPLRFPAHSLFLCVAPRRVTQV